MDEAEAAFRQGGEHFAAARLADAVAAYTRAIALGLRDPAAYFNLGAALWRMGDLAASAAALRNAEKWAPGNERILGALVEVVAAWTTQGGGVAWPEPCARRDELRDVPVSIVVCSIDPEKLARARANFEARLGERSREFIVINDARSLAEGYNRGLAASRNPVVVFSHDDVELVSPQPFECVVDALSRSDVVGLVGSRQVTGPTVTWAGHPHLHGWIAHPAKDREGLRPSIFSLATGLIHGMQALDGAFFAARREAALRVGFDEATFDGFHFYDLDFTYRAHSSGLRVAVTTDVLAIHQSRGDFGISWQRAAEKFAAKYPQLRAGRGANHAYAATVPDRNTLLRFYGTIRHLALA